MHQQQQDNRSRQPIRSEIGSARVYLETERWEKHIKTHHITNPPEVRGKRTTTWWPVLHSATGIQTMSEADVVQVIMEAAREGIWQNAPRGTLLATYDLPESQAIKYGVTQVAVSMAPDGRVLSAYPVSGPNVLAVKEIAPEQPQQNPLDLIEERRQQPQHRAVPSFVAGAPSPDEDEGWTA